MKLSMDRAGGEPRLVAAFAVISACLTACSSGVSPGQTIAGDDAGLSAGEDGGDPLPDGATGPAPDGGAGEASPSRASDAAADLGPQSPSSSGASTADGPGAVTCHPALPAVTASTQYTCNPGGPGKCDDCGDCAMVIDGTASTETASCGTSCIGQPDTCVTSCLSGKSPALSGGCQTCLVALFNCTTTYCAGPCVTGTKAQCSACLAANPSPGASSCNSVFLQCAGLASNPGYTGG